MAFATGALTDFQKVAGGETLGIANVILTATTFEDGLKVGRFAKFDAGSIDNLDASATPKIAGVVLRNISAALDAGETVSKTYNKQVEFLRSGLVTVDVKTGETPTKFQTVYAWNVADANAGLATATSTTAVDTGAEFIEEVKTGTWLVRLK